MWSDLFCCNILIFVIKYMYRGDEMAIYVIADLHLSFNEPKPMNIFGDNWGNHEDKIKTDWINKVKPEDTVLHLYLSHLF